MRISHWECTCLYLTPLILSKCFYHCADVPDDKKKITGITTCILVMTFAITPLHAKETKTVYNLSLVYIAGSFTLDSKVQEREMSDRPTYTMGTFLMVWHHLFLSCISECLNKEMACMVTCTHDQ